MERTEKALILATGRFRESDLWIRMLTPGMGIQTGFAFGGCKSRRRFCGCLDRLNLVLFNMKRGKGDTFTLQEGSLIKTFPSIRESQEKLGLAANCLSFVEALQPGHEGAKQTFSILCDALELIDQHELSFDFALYFRLKIASLHGFAPDFGACHVCGAKISEIASPCFAVPQGRVVCKEHMTEGGIMLSRGAVFTLRHALETEPAQWKNLHMEPGVRKECFRLADAFIEYHLGISWDRGAYRRT